MTELKILGVLLDTVLLMLIVFMVTFLFITANEMAEESEKHWPPPGSIPEHVYERLLNGDGYWE
tara:strand:- start:430 stop:621 length:192 start_codon:yes stop_codon:yes gene_type:complete